MSNEAHNLAGRRLLVVGGGQQDYGQQDPPVGIGRAICVLAAREGAAVAVLDRDLPAAEETAQAVRAEGAVGVTIEAEASDESACQAAVERAAAELGGLDGLVLNVGVAGGQGFENTTSEIWDLVFSINVRAHFLAVKHSLTHLEPQSSIVFISSTASRVPSTSDIPAYAASKAALDGLARFTARAGGASGIRANVVMAGLIDTSLGRLATLVKPDRTDISIPLGRQGTAWDVAHGATFLLSNQANYITGQTLVIDGGLTNAA